MNPAADPLLSRKDIAMLLGPHITARQVANNEKKWGLDKARVKLKTRSVLYRGSVAMLILKTAYAVN